MHPQECIQSTSSVGNSYIEQPKPRLIGVFSKSRRKFFHSPLRTYYLKEHPGAFFFTKGSIVRCLPVVMRIRCRGHTARHRVGNNQRYNQNILAVIVAVIRAAHFVPFGIPGCPQGVGEQITDSKHTQQTGTDLS